MYIRHKFTILICASIIQGLLLSVLPTSSYAQGCKFNAGPPPTCTSVSSTGKCSPVDSGPGPTGTCRVLGGEECECHGGGVPPPRGYILNVQPDQAQVRPNVNAAYTVAVTPSGGYSGTVEIDCSFGGKSMTCEPQHQDVIVPGTAHIAVVTPLQGKYGITFTGKDQQGAPAINGDQTATLIVTNGGGATALGTLAGLLILWGMARTRIKRNNLIEC